MRLTSVTYPNGRVVDYNYNDSAGFDTIMSRITERMHTSRPPL